MGLIMNPINITTKTPDYLEKRASQFRRLNEKEMQSGILGKIKQFLGAVLQKASLDINLKWQTHVHAEHMSQGSLGGNSQLTALAKTVEILEKMNNPPQNLIDALNYAKGVQSAQIYVDSFLDLTLVGGVASNLVKANIIKNDIKNLKINESLAIPSSCERHEMLLFITRQENGNFKVVQHNQGLGIGRFHYSKGDASGKKLFQTALEFSDVTEEKLCGGSALFIERVLANSIPFMGTIDHLYLNLLPMLQGNPHAPSEDPRLWGHGQLGGSCSAASGLSVIRSQLDKDSFKEFRDIGRTEMLLKSYKQIKKGWGNHSTQRAVTLEVVKKLEHSLKKRGKELPEEMLEMKRQLEGINKKNTDLLPHPFNTLPDNINFAFNLMKDGKFDDASLETARPYMEKALSFSSLPASQEELKKLWEISNQLRSYSRDKPLSINQIYMMTVMSSALLDKARLSEIAPSDKKLQALSKFCYGMHYRYNALSLGTRFQNSIYESYLLPHQKIILRPSNPLMPEGLYKLITKIGKKRKLP